MEIIKISKVDTVQQNTAYCPSSSNPSVLWSIFGLWLLGFLLPVYSRSLKHLYSWYNTETSDTGCVEENGFAGKTRMLIHLTHQIREWVWQRLCPCLWLSSDKLRNYSNLSVFLLFEFCRVTSLFRHGFYFPFCSLATHKTSLWNSPIACNRYGWCRTVQKLSVGR